VSGTFAGLPEGATYATGVADFRITYAGGDGNDVVLITVAHSTTTLSQSSTSTSTGQPVTFTAFVSGSGTPTGTVTFRDGTTVLGTSPLNASAVATLTTSSLANGSHPITAFYNGDAANGGSPSNQIQHDVLDPATIPTLDAKGLAALALLLGIAAMFVLRRH
ncbi:MAG: hypothetical protein JWO56_2596, partial [Acidobacteria bacterium]|nr:hypothetical protein [Acidobacteriota bacterium]